MAYNGGYQEQGRPYAGPAAARPGPPRQQYHNGAGGPAPQQYSNAPPPQQYNSAAPPQQQYDQYQQDGYGYDDGYGGGYDQGYDQQYDGTNYGRGPPPNQNYPPSQQDYYNPGPGRGGPPMGRARGGAMGRPPPGNGRGQYPPRGGPGPGRGGYPPQGRDGRPAPERQGNSDPTGNRRPTIDPTGSADGGFGGSPFPSFPGSRRKTDMEQEQDIIGQMGAMEISDGQRPPPRGRGARGMGPPRGPPPPHPGDGYGRRRPSMDNAGRGGPRPYPPQQGYPEPRRGPPSGQGYGAPMGYPEENFGPPVRSMTMPAREPPMDGRDPISAFPPRSESMRTGPPGGRGMVPPRPSTAQAMRQPPPPRDMYPPNNGPQGGYPDPGPGPVPGPGYDNPDAGYGGAAQQQRPASLDDLYGYYDDSRASGDFGPPQQRGSVEGGVPQFDAGPPQRSRESYGSQTQGLPAPGQPQLQGGLQRVPEVSRTKSQPDLRQSQTVIFEMAGDIPPIPTQYQQKMQAGHGQNGSLDMQRGYEQAGQGQNGSLDMQRGYEQAGQPGPGGMPSNPAAGHMDGLPSHPAPYRPGQQQEFQPGTRPLQPAHAQGADGLLSHPVPVRVGLMPKPPPVRNYNGPAHPTPVPASAPPTTQSQAPAPQQPAGGGPPAQAKVKEPPVTVEELEHLKTIIKSNPQDQVSALSLAKRLVEASEVLVPVMPDPKSRNRARDRYLTDAQKILKKLNSAGNVEATFLLADCLGRGLFSGGEPDNKEAFLLYQSAAKQGHAGAAYRTAVCCEIGNEEGGGTRKDPLKAIQWYRRAATLGDTAAMYKVGMILLKGLLGQARNPREAITWLKRAAERADADNPHALHELGLLYETAEGTDPTVRDPAYAFELFKQAADMGYKFSQFRLGAAYEYGLMGVPVDARLSILWYSRAATQAEHQSELALSGWYLTGSEGVLQQSDTEAYLWARKAAQAGLAKAEFAMGYYTEQGIGVPENLEDAKRWYWRAAAQDYPDARKRLEELKRMGKNVPRQRERITRNKAGKQQEGECSVM